MSDLSGLTYQWYEAGTGAISGATQSSYKIDSLTSSGVYYCIVKDSNDSSFSITSNNISISVNPVATITATAANSQYAFSNSKTTISSATGTTSSVSIDYGQSVTFSVSETGLALNSSWTYTWQYLDKTSNTWQTLTGTTADSNVSESSIAATSDVACYESGLYRIELVDGTNSPIYSGTIAINVIVPKLIVNVTSTTTTSSTVAKDSTLTADTQSATSNQTASADATVSLAGTYGDSYILSVDSTNYWLNSVSSLSDLTYQWYEAGHGAIEGANKASYTISSLTANGVYYCIVKDGNDSSFSITSNNIDITVNPSITITATPVSSTYGFGSSTTSISASSATTNSTNYATIDYGQSVTLSVSETGIALNSNWTYTWQYLNQATGSWQTVSGTTTNSTVTGTSISETGAIACYQTGTYRIELVDGSNSPLYSGIISITVMVPKLAISVAPSSTTNVVLASATNADNTTSANSTKNTITYQYGDSYTLSIDANNYWLSSVCGLAGLSYQWYEVGVGAIADQTSSSYTISSLQSSGSYYCEVTNSNDPSFNLKSNIIAINLAPQSSPNITYSVQTTADNENAKTVYGESNVTLSLSNASVNSFFNNLPNADFTWYLVSSQSGSADSALSYSKTYSFNIADTSTYYLQVSANGKTYTSNYITIVVDNNLTLNSAQTTTSSNSNTISLLDLSTGEFGFGTNVTISPTTGWYQYLTNSDNSSNFTYQWNKLENGTWTPLSSNATSIDYSFTAYQTGTYQLAVYYNGNTTACFTGSINIPVTTPTAVISASPVNSGTYQTFNNNTTQITSAKDNLSAATIDYGQSITISATLTGGRHSVKSWTYTWQYLDQASGTWQTLSGTNTAQLSTSFQASIDSFTCYQTATYRIQFVNSGDPTYPIYSGIITVNVNVPPLTIVKNDSKLNIESTNYWLGNISNLQNIFTYSWYKVGDATALTQSQTATSYTPTSSGTYYCVVTDPNDPNTSFAVTSNYVDFTLTPKAVITASPQGLGFVTASGTLSSNTVVSSSASIASIDFGQSVQLTASITGETLNSNWTYTWQYLNQTTGTWQGISTISSGNATGQVANTNNLVTPVLFTCYQTETYRLEVTNSNDPDSTFYSGLISIDVIQPKLMINIASANSANESAIASNLASSSTDSSSTNNSTSQAPTSYTYGNAYTLSIESGNYWLTSVNGLSGLTYTWYEVGNTSALQTSTTLTSYTISSLTSNGTYYCVVTDSNYPALSVTSNQINVSVSPAVIITATPTNSTYGFGTTTTSISSPSNNSTATTTNYATIDYGQSVKFSASVQGLTLNSNWTYTWQYLDAASGSWQTITGTTPNIEVTGTTITATSAIACYQTGSYRIMLTDGKNAPIYSGIVSINVTVPAFEINVTNENTGVTATTNSVTYDPGTPAQFGIVSTNYWASSEGAANISDLTYSWYAAGNSTAVYTGTTYATAGLLASGSYYCVITNSNDPSFSVTSNIIVVNTSTDFTYNMNIIPYSTYWGVPKQSTYGFLTSTGEVSNVQKISTNSDDTSTYLYYGESVQLNSRAPSSLLQYSQAVGGAWKSAYQYFDQASNSWQTVPSTDAVNNVTSMRAQIECFQTATYRLKYWDSTNPSYSFYSPTLTVNLIKPKLDITVSDAASSSTPSIYQSGGKYVLNVTDNNFWNQNVSMLPQNWETDAGSVQQNNLTDYTFTYTWYEVGNPNYLSQIVAKNTGTNEVGDTSNATWTACDTSYTINSLTSSGSYYCVITNNVNSNFSVTSNIIQMNLPSATITATPTSSQYGFVNSNGANSSVTEISSASGNDDGIIDYGQSVTFNASVDGVTLNSDWTYTWQYLDPSSDSWQTVSGATANAAISGSTISSFTAACYKPYAYRIELTNSTLDDSIYSGIILINTYTPSLQISIPNDNATTIALTHNIILKGSGHQQPITPEASIVSNNYDYLMLVI